MVDIAEEFPPDVDEAVEPRDVAHGDRPHSDRPHSETSTSRHLVSWSALLRIARPKQWVKNLLVFAAPGAAGVLTHTHDLLLALGASAIFCLVSSGTYFLNDTFDAAADRLHPIKRFRPVASGEVSEALAATTGVAVVAGSIGLSWWLAGIKFSVAVAVYAAISIAYSARLKHVAVIDLACVSSGFIIRAIAGGLATKVPLTYWFLIVAGFGSLLVVTGKRSAEHRELGDDRAEHRPTLGTYPPTFLRSIRLLSAAVTITAYSQWAFERASHFGGGHHAVWFQMSIAPVVLALLHLELRFETGHGAAPEDLALHDHMLQVLGLVWVILFAVGVYA